MIVHVPREGLLFCLFEGPLLIGCVCICVYVQLLQKTMDAVNEKLSLYVSRDKEVRKPTYTIKNRYVIRAHNSHALHCTALRMWEEERTPF
jgi:hypothetical protein